MTASLTAALARSSTWDRVGLFLRALVPLVVLGVGGFSTFAAAVAFQEAGLLTVRRIWRGNAFASRLFLAAFAGRALLASVLHAYLRVDNGNGAFPLLQDDYANDIAAAWLLRIADGEGLSLFTGHKHVLDNLFPFLVTSLYAVLGYAPLAPKVLNAAIGALCAVLVFDIAGNAFRRRVGQVAGIGAAALPSLLLWSTVTLKEILVLLAVLAALRGLQALAHAPARTSSLANGGLVLVVALVLLADLRPPVVALVGALAASVVGWRLTRRVPRLYLAAFGLALLATSVGGVLLAHRVAPESAISRATHVGEKLVELRQRRGWEALNARSQFGSPADIEALNLPETGAGPETSPEDQGRFDLSRDVAQPLAFSLLAPAPWQARNARDLAAGLEMLVWYVLLAAACVSWRAGVRQRATLVLIATYGVATWVALAVSEGNLGNLLRHRIMLSPVVLILGSAGLVYAWEQWNPVRRREPRSPAIARQGALTGASRGPRSTGAR